MERVAYCIDLDSRKPEVLEYSNPELQIDLDYFKVKNPLDLTTPDRRVFLKERDAETFLINYKRALLRLKRLGVDTPRSSKGMLYKRRYMLLAAMGLKSFTVRGYWRDWTPGTIFKFYDQTFFIECRLIAITQHDYGYKYSYTLV